MKRKTNLFYVDGPDSKFLTFSNYTEALTGNFLSVNTKLFPDHFLCLNIKNLNNITKPLFIQYLVRYYENKLAALRDNNIHENRVIEEYIYPLAYLLEAILKVVKVDELDEYYLNIDDNNEIIVNDNPINFDNDNEIKNLITYIGDVTEQDYNGTYTDIICNINCENYIEGIFTRKQSETSELILNANIDNNIDKLYGWEDEFNNDSSNASSMINNYISLSPYYDNIDETSGIYNHTSILDKLIFKKIDEADINSKTLKFNIIIPLFSAVNIDTNYEAYKDHIKKNELQQNYIELSNDNRHCFDTPLGIWINADKDVDTPIILEKDTTLNLYPNWSLLISTQFKPFPYSTSIQKTNDSNNDNANCNIWKSYATFAETLTKINDVLDKFNEINENLVILTNRINDIEKNVKDIGTTANINKLNEKVVEVESSVNSKINDFKNQISGYLNLIKWSGNG